MLGESPGLLLWPSVRAPRAGGPRAELEAIAAAVPAPAGSAAQRSAKGKVSDGERSVGAERGKQKRGLDLIPAGSQAKKRRPLVLEDDAVVKSKSNSKKKKQRPKHGKRRASS